MLDLTSDLLELARLKQAREQFATETSPQPAAEILEEVHDLLREQAEEKKQTLDVKIRNHPAIRAKRDHLRQIWTNLISNAIKYTPEGGNIVVSLWTDDGRLVGTVEDSGIGIAQEDLPNLFQDFFRTDQAKASGEIGTGLGLSIVKQIVEGYQGELSVTSELGEGTRFTFVLPLDPPRAGPTKPA
jgi:signal transduction histidine kinase